MFTYVQNILIFIGIYAVVAISLNLEYGFTGLGNFGKVAFVMLGAYAYGIASVHGVNPALCFILAALVSGFFGLLVSLPALRLREDYLAIVTLTFGEIMRMILKSEEWIANGVRGLSVSPALPLHLSGYQAGLFGNIALVFLFLAACFILLQLVSNSPYGRIMRAIREDQLATDAYGKHVTRYKAQVFMLGSAIAGLGGALYAQFVGLIVPDGFLPAMTFTIWIMVILGGPGNNWGALLGAVAVQVFQNGANILKDYVHLPIDPNNLQYILFGVLILLVLFFRPSGLLRESPVRVPFASGGKGSAKGGQAAPAVGGGGDG
jgi:branched-chain amino acid transport system permease protein